MIILGQGRTSEVIEERVDGRSFAVKKVRPRRKGLIEAEYLRKLNHANIVKLDRFVETEEGVSLYLELFHQNLWDFVIEKGKQLLSEKAVLQIGLQIASALDYLHEKGLVHHDIKPHNILLNDDLKIKLCDFGSSSELIRGSSLIDGLGKGTTPYCAPEIFYQLRYDHKIDIYSFGVVMWVLLTGRAPFDNVCNPVALIGDIKAGVWFEFPRNCLDGSLYHADLVNLIKSCLEVDPLKRPTSFDLLARLQRLALLETETSS